MDEKDGAEVRIVPAKVHGDSGETAVVAETGSTEAEDIEQSEADDVERIEGEIGKPSSNKEAPPPITATGR
jgi:hypothetical protein